MLASVVTGAAVVLKLVSVRPTLQLRVRSLSGNFHLLKPAELKPLDAAEESRQYYPGGPVPCVEGYSLLIYLDFFIIQQNNLLGSAKRWSLGCMNLLPVAKGSQEVEFTQPRAHFLADPCMCSLSVSELLERLSSHLPLLIRTLLVCRSGHSVAKTRENRPPKEPFFASFALLSSSFRSRLSCCDNNNIPAFVAAL